MRMRKTASPRWLLETHICHQSSLFRFAGARAERRKSPESPVRHLPELKIVDAKVFADQKGPEVPKSVLPQDFGQKRQGHQMLRETDERIPLSPLNEAAELAAFSRFTPTHLTKRAAQRTGRVADTRLWTICSAQHKCPSSGIGSLIRTRPKSHEILGTREQLRSVPAPPGGPPL
jgi:hypothetical protein